MECEFAFSTYLVEIFLGRGGSWILKTLPVYEELWQERRGMIDAIYEHDCS